MDRRRIVLVCIAVVAMTLVGASCRAPSPHALVAPRTFLVTFDAGCPTGAIAVPTPGPNECASISAAKKSECMEVSKSSGVKITVEADKEGDEPFVLVPKPNSPPDLWEELVTGKQNKWKFKLANVEYPDSGTLTYEFSIKNPAQTCEHDPTIIINK